MIWRGVWNVEWKVNERSHWHCWTVSLETELCLQVLYLSTLTPRHHASTATHDRVASRSPAQPVHGPTVRSSGHVQLARALRARAPRSWRAKGIVCEVIVEEKKRSNARAQTVNLSRGQRLAEESRRRPFSRAGPAQTEGAALEQLQVAFYRKGHRPAHTRTTRTDVLAHPNRISRLPRRRGSPS